MNAKKFAEYVKEYLENLAEKNGIENLERYYSQSDYQFKEINELSGINQVFAQFVLHAQNATILCNIVKFFDNYKFLYDITKGFSPKEFLNEINFKNESDRDKCVLSIVEKLKYNPVSNSAGLKWSTKSKKPLIKRFANSLIDGAVYFIQFNEKQEVINDLEKHYDSFETLSEYFIDKIIKHGFSNALCCDFLKELDSTFDLPKPDVHIMETLAKYNGYNLDYYKNRPVKCVNDFLCIVKEIKDEQTSMTAYKLDRQIWLCCTGNFFLDEKTFSKRKSCFKEEFLRAIN